MIFYSLPSNLRSVGRDVLIFPPNCSSAVKTLISRDVYLWVYLEVIRLWRLIKDVLGDLIWELLDLRISKTHTLLSYHTSLSPFSVSKYSKTIWNKRTYATILSNNWKNISSAVLLLSCFSRNFKLLNCFSRHFDV